MELPNRGADPIFPNINLTGLDVWKRITIYWHIFHSSGFHHICNIKCRLDCRYSPQNIFNAKNYNPHKKPIFLLHVPICTQGMQRTWWPEAGTIRIESTKTTSMEYVSTGVLSLSLDRIDQIYHFIQILLSPILNFKWRTPTDFYEECPLGLSLAPQHQQLYDPDPVFNPWVVVAFRTYYIIHAGNLPHAKLLSV